MKPPSDKKIRLYECSQCGATDFEQVGESRVRCSYCKSLYEMLTTKPRIVVNKGAHVVFGKQSRVEIRGGMEIESGAEVDFQGTVILVNGTRRQDFKLRRIANKKHAA